VKEAGAIIAPVEIEVLRELARLLVHDIYRTVHVDDEKTIGASWFFADRVDARQQHFVRRLTDGQPGDGDGREIFNLEGQRLLRVCDGSQA
jgi:hypothetical protein